MPESEHVKVEVLASHTYDGVFYSRGDVYECRRRYLKAQVALGRIKVWVEPPKPAPKRTPRKKVEPQVTTRAITAEETPEEDVTEAPRQRYTRRDLRAEDD